MRPHCGIPDKCLFPDVHFDMKRFYTGSDHIAFEYDMSGTFEGTRLTEQMAW